MKGYLKRLMWLFATKGSGGGSGGTAATVTGTPPLTLPNALAKAIRSLTQYGKVTQSTTPTPSSPVDIVCNNGVLKYGALGKNWFYDDDSETGYINSEGNRVGSTGWNASDYIPVLPSTQYYFNPNTSAGSTAKHAFYSADKTFIDYIASGAGAFTTPATCAFVRFSYRSTSTDVQLELGDSPTTYEPYKGKGIYFDGTPEVLSVGGRTASVQSLLAVGDVTDEQNIISGHVVRRIGVYVFDGTETWIDGNYGYITEAVQDQSGETYTPLSTHFKGTTGTPQSNTNTFRCYRTSGGVGRIYIAPNRTTYDTKEAFAAFVAAQFAAGTPVIVVYPLAEEATETVEPQHLNTTAGTNTVSVTAEVQGIELEVTYMKSGGN